MDAKQAHEEALEIATDTLNYAVNLDVRAYLAALAERGWKLVPPEMTLEMLRAVYNEPSGAAQWRAALNAAPPFPGDNDG